MSVRSVVARGEEVFVSFIEALPEEQAWLLHGSDKIAFKPVLLDASSQKRSIYGPLSKLTPKYLRGGKELQDDVCNVFVNLLEDWFVDGFETLQIEFKEQKLPFTLTFPSDVDLQNDDYSLQFEAMIAAHRIRATFIVEFFDLESSDVFVERVSFDPAYSGGKFPDGYQKVILPIPTGVKKLRTQISIDFDGNTEPNSPYHPWVFLSSLQLCEASKPGEEGNSFVEDDFKFKWIRAKAKCKVSPLDPIFIKMGEKITVLPTKQCLNTKQFFSESYYMAENVDVDFTHIDPFTHYLLQGWKDRRNPNSEFSIREYMLRHSDIDAAGIEPLTHYANKGFDEGRTLGNFTRNLTDIWHQSGEDIPSLSSDTVIKRAQDLMVPMNIISTRKIAVFLVPEHNAVSGGIYSIFSIADHVRRTRREHGFDVLVMTRPNQHGLTYIRQSSFKNSETVLRFDLLRLFSEVSELQLHIPEYATTEFVRSLTPVMMNYLLSRDYVHINILNQNTRLMPERDKFKDLRRIADSIGQSISHHAFFGQEFADHYGLPSLLLPAYTDLDPYPAIPFAEKENLIIYSDDDAPYRRAVLDRLSAMGDYELVRIREITFDTYMDLATRCRFSVTFGEGFDGYVAQPMYQGGIGFALYTDEFFPDDSYRELENFFETEEEMIEQIVPTIRRLEADQARYEALNAAMRTKWDALYSYDDYVARIGKLIRREYELFPAEDGE